MKKTVVITGGSDGLGRALAEAVAADFQVVVVARDEARLREVAAKTGGDFAVCDVRDPAQVAKCFDEIAAKHGSIDVLVNNAGVVVNGELPDTSDEDIRAVIETNTLGGIYVAKAALKHMRQQRSGLIINVVSQAGLVGRAGRSVYNASKWGLTGFTKALQEEAAPYGVRVTGFYPGTIRTELFAKAGMELRGAALNLDQVVRALEFLLATDESVLVPELGLKTMELGLL